MKFLLLHVKPKHAHYSGLTHFPRRSSILHYGPLIETNNLNYPTPNGNIRVRL